MLDVAKSDTQRWFLGAALTKGDRYDFVVSMPPLRSVEAHLRGTFAWPSVHHGPRENFNSTSTTALNSYGSWALFGCLQGRPAVHARRTSCGRAMACPFRLRLQAAVLSSVRARRAASPWWASRKQRLRTLTGYLQPGWHASTPYRPFGARSAAASILSLHRQCRGPAHAPSLARSHAYVSRFQPEAAPSASYLG
jgi:hypothetical protein